MPSALRFSSRVTEELMDQPDILTGNVSEDNDLCRVMCLYECKSEEIQYY